MSSHSFLSRRGFIGGSGAALTALLLGGCGSSGSSNASGSGSEVSATNLDGNTPEVTTINWARAQSGNIFVTLAQQKGYFAEEGLTVVENPVENDTDAFTALSTGNVDVTSNQGTKSPLSQIAAGQDFTIVGGYMLQGMYLIAKKGTKWNGVKDLVGKKVATGGGVPELPLAWGLVQAGYDPLNDVEWVNGATGSDKYAMTVAGEADYGYESGDMHQTIDNSDDVDIVAYSDEIMPAYGCCRMNMRTDFVKNNPNTMTGLLRALVRANAYLYANLDESVSILAKELNTDEDYCAAYLKNEHYKLDVDPVKNKVIDNWGIMQDIGIVTAKQAKEINIEDHINTEYYKNAIDYCAEHYADDYPDWWSSRQDFFQENNA